jgi:hypothetical protein
MRPLPFVLSAAIPLVALVLAVSPARADDVPTFADRSSHDVEEVDRSSAVMLNPLAIAQGVYGGDVDLVLGKHFAVSLEGDIYSVNGTAATAFGAGLLFYPSATLHGLYLEPRVIYARPLTEGLVHFDWSTDVLGLGATAGWQWTWDYGFTLRLGGGGMYFMGGQGQGALALAGPQLVLDGSVGWAF